MSKPFTMQKNLIAERHTDRTVSISFKRLFSDNAIERSTGLSMTNTSFYSH